LTSPPHFYLVHLEEAASQNEANDPEEKGYSTADETGDTGSFVLVPRGPKRNGADDKPYSGKGNIEPVERTQKRYEAYEHTANG
jgi:hypothetical protein